MNWTVQTEAVSVPDKTAQIPVTGTIGIRKLFEFDRGVIMLENHHVVFRFVFRLQGGPADLHRSHLLAQANGQRLFFQSVSHKVGSGHKIGKQMANKKGFNRTRMISEFLRSTGKLAAQNVRGIITKPGDNVRIKAFNAVVPIIGLEQFQRVFAQLSVTSAALKLYDHWHTAVYGIEHFGKVDREFSEV